MKPKTILFADDDPDLLRLLVAKCKAISPHLEVVYARNAMTALTTTNVLRPDLVCIDVNMPRGNGMAVCEMIAAHADLNSIPIVVLTGMQDDDTRKRCQQISAHYVSKSGAVWHQLEPIIRSILPSETAPEPEIESELEIDSVETEMSVEDFLNALDAPLSAPVESIEEAVTGSNPTVLVIDDDPAWGGLIKRRLESKGIDVLHSVEGLGGFRQAVQNDVIGIILDYEMDDVQGDYVLGRLKDNPITKDIPVIVVTGQANNALKRKVLNIGASSFLNKPCTWDRLWAELQRRTALPV
ncbi:response regulator [Roseiconus sp. JC912]